LAIRAMGRDGRSALRGFASFEATQKSVR